MVQFSIYFFHLNRYSSVQFHRDGYPGQRRSYTDRERAPTPTDEEDSLGDDGKVFCIMHIDKQRLPVPTTHLDIKVV